MLDGGKVLILEFLKILNSIGEWFPKDLKLRFVFEEDNEKETTNFIMKDYYGPNWSSPYQFEFNFDT